MNQTLYTTENKKNNRGAFGRIAQPYSGAAPRVFVIANLVLGVRFSNLASLNKKN